MQRRQFLHHLGLFSASTAMAIGSQAWAWGTPAPASPSQRLIVVFLRGGIDGLSVVVPYRESLYYQARPRIALPPAGKEGGVLALDSYFGLHPSLAMLLPLWQQGTLAFVHACGSPAATRSHFEAQDYMESGTPNLKTTADGWMNRLLAALSGRNPLQAVNVGATTPRILSGRMSVATLASGRRAGSPLPIDRPQVSQAFDRLYRGGDPLSQSYREGRTARQALLQDLEQEMEMANNGAGLPQVFRGDAQRLARLMRRDERVKLGFLAVGGWDTHVNQGNHQGQLANRLQALGEGLAALAKELGPAYGHTTILVMSEFGRTVRENGNGGTDHGHGNVLWALGGKVQGGKIYGDWRGLAGHQLYEGRDLPVTTDFRAVVLSVLERQFRLQSGRLSQVFPGYSPKDTLNLLSV
jgi:uncharacterized protein (DUF1501 family)